VVADHLRFDMGGIRTEMLAEVNAKALAVEIGTCAQHHRAGRRLACDVGERVGRIGDHEQHRVGRRPHDPRHDIAIDFGVPVEQFEAAQGVVAIGRAAGFFVHAHSDQHDAGALEVVVIAVDDVDLGTERRAVAHVGRHRFGGLAGGLTRTISRALPRVTAAIAHAQPTLPVPIMPIFTTASVAGSTRRSSGRSGQAACKQLPLSEETSSRRQAPPVLATVRPSCRANEPLTPLPRGSPRTGTRCGARPRRSSSRSGWRSPRRRACRKSRGPRASSPPAVCCRRAAPQAYPRA
jgi:hypothetical protein